MYLLSAILESIISEKHTQFRGKNNLLIESKLEASSYGLYAKIKIDAFKRVISYLINNAVEALGDDGIIQVRMGVGNQGLGDRGQRSGDDNCETVDSLLTSVPWSLLHLPQ